MQNTSRASLTKKVPTALILVCLFLAAIVPSVPAADDWKTSFEQVCSKVDVSDTLSIKELETLIEQADKLLPEIQRSDDASKKVYLQRLKKCRSLYEFSIELKKEPGK